jgi:hypothetical protein
VCVGFLARVYFFEDEREKMRIQRERREREVVFESSFTKKPHAALFVLLRYFSSLSPPVTPSLYL